MKRQFTIKSNLIKEEEMGDFMRVWKIAPGPGAMYWGEAVVGERIFIGWSEMEDLRRFNSQEDLIEHFKGVYQIDHNPTNNGFTLWAFSKLVQPGDIVIANKGGRSIVGIGRVTGEYQYLPDKNHDYPNFRTVDWIIRQEIVFSQKLFPNKTLAEVSHERVDLIYEAVMEQVEGGEAKWIELFGEDYSSARHHDLDEEREFIDEFHAFLMSKNYYFSREIISRFVFSLAAKPFLILSGISGTGKTKIAQLFAEFMSEHQIERVPSQQVYQKQTTFKVTLQRYNFAHTRMMVPKTILDQFDIQGLDEGVTVVLRFADKTEEALMKQQMTGVRLGFRKGFMEWLRKQFTIGSTLHIQVADDGKSWSFDKSPSQMVQEPVPAQQQALPKQYAFLSVRPDWLDHRGVLGYYNPLTQSYQVTDLLKIMLRAQRFPEHPFFVILDEMNLAKVEYYFSDFLSCLESRRMTDDGRFVQEKLVLHHEDAEVAQSLSFVDEDGAIYYIPSSMEVPDNLYIIGTVNVDETTYMFSPKVLDRAHVIECNEVDFATYRRVAKEQGAVFKPTWAAVAKREWFTANGEFHQVLYRKSFLSTEFRTRLEPLFTLADELKSLMMSEGYSFGYRVFDEMFTFIQVVMEEVDAFDIMILQKILPKLHGNRAQMETILNHLFQFCRADQALDEEGGPGKRVYAHAIQEDYNGDYSGFRFKRSAGKLQAMYKQLLRTGYCSFIQ